MLWSEESSTVDFAVADVKPNEFDFTDEFGLLYLSTEAEQKKKKKTDAPTEEVTVTEQPDEVTTEGAAGLTLLAH